MAVQPSLVFVWKPLASTEGVGFENMYVAEQTVTCSMESQRLAVFISLLSKKQERGLFQLKGSTHIHEVGNYG